MLVFIDLFSKELGAYSMELKYFVTKEEVNNLAEKWWDLDWELRGTLATTGTSGES